MAPLPRAFAPRAVRLLAVALAALLAGARVVGLGPFEVTESRLFDALIRPLLPPAPTDPRIVIVEIDDRTLADLGERWPLERATWAQFLRRLAVYEPVAVAADVMFDLPELGNERAILDELRQQVLRSPLGGKDDGREVVGWIDGIDRRIDADQDLARAMGELGNVTLGLLCTADAGLKAHPTITTSLEHDGQGLATRAEHVMASHPALALAARASGAMNVTIDPDGTVRRYPYAIAVDGVAWPSLALAVALSDADPAARRAMMERVVAADGGTPTLRFRAQTQPWARVSLSDVMLAPHTEGLARLLRGKIIFLGATAIGIEDLQRTPVADRTAGIELHATAHENLTQGSWLVTGGTAAWATLALVVVVVGGLALFLGRRRAGSSWWSSCASPCTYRWWCCWRRTRTWRSGWWRCRSA
ncbi:MAG: CHASE2 domain-containing protein [Deltaproteobacteria bacterium]|nr:CHASE2 domain-containing protein [Deltaproteobacteria bacterium]